MSQLQQHTRYVMLPEGSAQAGVTEEGPIRCCNRPLWRTSQDWTLFERLNLGFPTSHFTLLSAPLSPPLSLPRGLPLLYLAPRHLSSPEPTALPASRYYPYVLLRLKSTSSWPKLLHELQTNTQPLATDNTTVDGTSANLQSASPQTCTAILSLT